MKQTRTWETETGEEFDICKMETSHIENCINMLDRKIKKGFEILIDCGYCGDDDYNTYESAFVVGKEAKAEFQPEYNWLKEELRKRKLLIIKK